MFLKQWLSFGQQKQLQFLEFNEQRSRDYQFEGDLHVSMFGWDTVAIMAIKSGKSIEELLIQGPQSKPGTRAYLSTTGMKP